MPNYRFTVLIRQDFSRYYIVDIIISSLIYKRCVLDNEEGQSFCKVNVIEWSRVLYKDFFVCRVAISQFVAMYLIQGLII